MAKKHTRAVAKKQATGKQAGTGSFDIIGSIKSAWHMAIHPSTAKPMSVRDAIKFYYSFAIIPGIIATIIAGLITGTVSAAVIMFGVIFVLEVIGIFVDAGIYHLFGKFLFKKFTQDYSVTFTATVVASIPAILFYWLSPITGGISSILFGIWGIILLTMALMKLQKVSGVVAVLSWLVPSIIIGILVVLLAIAAFSAIGALPVAGNLTSNFTTTALTTI